jgi:Macrocin-O-methyltransferase (TylF)
VDSGISRDTARTAAARAGLAGAREPRAIGPGADTESLRVAYLELLKLSLCDLAGTSTVSVGAMPDGTVMARELSGHGLRLRSAGMDWPLQGLTMTGLTRLDDLQACVESVVRDGVEGDLVEAGAWRGGSSILMRATLDSLGEERTVWVADSFQGFPEGAERDPVADLSTFEFLSVPADEVQASFDRLGLHRGVRIVEGFFEQTLPGLAGETWAIARLDGDTYDATWAALESLYDGLSVGGYLIVDDYGGFDECRDAVDRFRRERGIHEPIEAVDWTCVRWRKGAEAEVDASLPPRQANGSAGEAAPRAARRPALRTQREVKLAEALAQTRARLQEAEARAARPLAGVRARLGRRRRAR